MIEPLMIAGMPVVTSKGVFEEESMLDLVDYSAYPAPYYGLCDEY